MTEYFTSLTVKIKRKNERRFGIIGEHAKKTERRVSEKTGFTSIGKEGYECRKTHENCVVTFG